MPRLNNNGARSLFHRGLWLALMLLAAPASAFVIESESVDGRLLYPRWTRMPVVFWLNDTPPSLISNLLGADTAEATLDAAMRAWSVGPIRLDRAGSTPSTDLKLDGMNLITFADTPTNRDVSRNFWAWTSYWYVREDDRLRMLEADIAFNPNRRFATYSVFNARDLQDLATHELGHCLGLHHSPITGATMYTDGAAGQTLARTLAADDIAGVRTLYESGETASGGVTGMVLTPSGDPVFGAHVVATDAAGIAQVGTVTARDGSFSLSPLAPGVFQVYAEPLDGPMIISQLPPSYAAGRTGFRTTFAGGNAAPAAVTVEAGAHTVLEPIRVEPTVATLNPQFLAWSPNGMVFRTPSNLPLEIQAGRSSFLVIAGFRLDTVPNDGFGVSGSDVTLDRETIQRGRTTTGAPYAVIPLTVAPGAPAGARNLYVANGSERAAFTGGLSVSEP